MVCSYYYYYYYVTTEVEIDVQNQKMYPEAISETPDGTTAIISTVKKVTVFREASREGLEEQAKKLKVTSSKKFQKQAAREGLEEQAKKLKVTFSKKFQKLTLGQNVRIKIPDIDRAKMDPRSIIAVITDIKGEEVYELATSWVS